MTFNFFSISSRLYFEILFKNYPDFIGPLIGHEWLNPVNVIRHSGVDSCVIGISACVSPARDTNLNAMDVDGTATVALFRIKTIHQHSVDNWIKFKNKQKIELNYYYRASVFSWGASAQHNVDGESVWGVRILMIANGIVQYRHGGLQQKLVIRSDYNISK